MVTVFRAIKLNRFLKNVVEHKTIDDCRESHFGRLLNEDLKLNFSPIKNNDLQNILTI
jgi:hypothetical protein